MSQKLVFFNQFRMLFDQFILLNNSTTNSETVVHSIQPWCTSQTRTRQTVLAAFSKMAHSSFYITQLTIDVKRCEYCPAACIAGKGGKGTGLCGMPKIYELGRYACVVGAAVAVQAVPAEFHWVIEWFINVRTDRLFNKWVGCKYNWNKLKDSRKHYLIGHIILRLLSHLWD